MVEEATPEPVLVQGPEPDVTYIKTISPSIYDFDDDQPQACAHCVVTVAVEIGSQPPLTLSFVMDARQAAPWLESATLGLQEGQSSSLVPESSDDSAVIHVTLNKLTPAKSAVETDRDKTLNGKDENESNECSAHVLRQKGNDIVKSADNSKSYRAAFLPYYRALQAPGIDDSISTAVHSNLSLVGLRTSDWTLAIAHADAAQASSSKLDQPPSTLAKTFFRRGSAFLQLNYTIAALAQFNRAHQLSPQDNAVKKERDRVHNDTVESLRKHKQDFAEVYSTMIQSPLFNNPLLL